MRRLEESSRELRALLGEEKLAGIPTLVPSAFDRRIRWIKSLQVRPVDQVKRKRCYWDVIGPSHKNEKMKSFMGMILDVVLFVWLPRSMQTSRTLRSDELQKSFCFSRLFGTSLYFIAHISTSLRQSKTTIVYTHCAKISSSVCKIYNSHVHFGQGRGRAHTYDES